MKFITKRRLALMAALASATVIATGVGSSLVHAATGQDQTTSNNIARYTMEETRLNGVAEVLKTTPAQLEDSLKTKSMDQIIKNAGLTNNSFRQKVKAQIQTDLQAAGYSSAQISGALSHGPGPMHHRPGNDKDK